MTQVMEPLLEKRGFSERRLLQNWTEIAGAEFSSRCIPLRLTYPTPENKKGQLYLGVFQAHNTELLHQTPQLIERINRFFGYEAVVSIRFQNFMPATLIPHKKQPDSVMMRDLPPQIIRDLETQINNPELRENLKILAAHILNQQSKPLDID